MYKGVFSVIIFSAISSFIFISCGTDTPVTPTTTDVNIQINDSAIKHAYITNFFPNTKFRNDDDFAAVAWIADTVPYIGRTLFKFNLSAIPQNATVTSAVLLLNYDQEPIHYTGVGHHQNSGSNSSYMQRITQNWVDTSATWNNQPGITQTNQISIDSSSSEFQNYSIDLTSAVNDMVQNPSLNYGFLFRLKKETPLRVLGFSWGIRNSSLKPILQVTYRISQ